MLVSSLVDVTHIGCISKPCDGVSNGPLGGKMGVRQVQFFGIGVEYVYVCTRNINIL